MDGNSRDYSSGARSGMFVGCPGVVHSANQNLHPLIGINSPIVISVGVQARTQSEILTSSEVSASPAYRVYLNRFFLITRAVLLRVRILLLLLIPVLVLPLQILRSLFVTVNCTSTGASDSSNCKSRNCTYCTCTTSTCTLNKFSHMS